MCVILLLTILAMSIQSEVEGDAEALIDLSESVGQVDANPYKPIKFKATSGQNLDKCLVVGHNNQGLPEPQVGSCFDSAWFHDTLANTISDTHGRCLTSGGPDDNKILTLSECGSATNKSEQQFRRSCGAFTTKFPTGGEEKLVFTPRNGKIILERYTGQEDQLTEYDRDVVSSTCAESDSKVMQFLGDSTSTMTIPGFIGMPSEQLTLAMWVQPVKGTPFSYATDTSADALVISLNPNENNHKELEILVTILGQVVNTKAIIEATKWSHIAVTWDSIGGGAVNVFINGKRAFEIGNVQAGKTIDAGGCAMVGQRGKGPCKERILTAAYAGRLTNVVLYNGVRDLEGIKLASTQPVNEAALNSDKRLIRTGSELPPKHMRLALLTKQYGQSDATTIYPRPCNIRNVPQEKGAIRTRGTRMVFEGSGLGQYSNFNTCKFTEHSSGEFIALQVDPKFQERYPLSVQFRTSPVKHSCPWCKKGSVSYIDGCAITYNGDQASHGFGGFDYTGSRYTPYASFNNKKADFSKKGIRYRGKFIRSFVAGKNWAKMVTADNVKLTCRQGFIKLSVPAGYESKVHGIAGTGSSEGDWWPGQASRNDDLSQNVYGLDDCLESYPFKTASSPFYGNDQSKSISTFIQSWAVGGAVKSAFGYGTDKSDFTLKDKTPLQGVVADRSSSAEEDATAACAVLSQYPNFQATCVYDYLVLGDRAVSRNVADALADSEDTERKISNLDVRDSSRFNKRIKWLEQPSWSCADEFLKHLDVYERTVQAKDEIDKAALEKASNMKSLVESEAKSAAALQQMRDDYKTCDDASTANENKISDLESELGKLESNTKENKSAEISALKTAMNVLKANRSALQLKCQKLHSKVGPMTRSKEAATEKIKDARARAEKDAEEEKRLELAGLSSDVCCCRAKYLGECSYDHFFCIAGAIKHRNPMPCRG